jgi:hypothetical protein
MFHYLHGILNLLFWVPGHLQNVISTITGILFLPNE